MINEEALYCLGNHKQSTGANGGHSITLPVAVHCIAEGKSDIRLQKN
jgi:hypothetical protein